MPRHEIKTFNPCPPIPERSFDWVAYYDDDLEDGEYGYGRTRQEAIDDLTNNCSGLTED